MKKYVMAFLKKGPNRDLDSAHANELQIAHLKNINRMAEEGKGMTREELLALFDRAAREEWKDLDLFGRGITDLPDEIGDLTHLRTLNLSNNQLTSLPHSNGQLRNLEE